MVGLGLLGGPHSPHPRLSGAPCPDGPLAPPNRQRRQPAQCAGSAPQKEGTAHPERGGASIRLAKEQRCHSDAPQMERARTAQRCTTQEVAQRDAGDAVRRENVHRDRGGLAPPDPPSLVGGLRAPPPDPPCRACSRANEQWQREGVCPVCVCVCVLLLLNSLNVP